MPGNNLIHDKGDKRSQQIYEYRNEDRQKQCQHIQHLIIVFVKQKARTKPQQQWEYDEDIHIAFAPFQNAIIANENIRYVYKFQIHLAEYVKFFMLLNKIAYHFFDRPIRGKVILIRLHLDFVIRSDYIFLATSQV